MFGRHSGAWRISLGIGLIALLLAACAPTAPLATPSPSASAVATTATEPQPAATTPAGGAALDGVQVGVDADGNFYRGNPDATVKLVEYSDFQCPYCGRHATTTEPEIDSNYVATGKVLHIFRHFPLPQLGHDHAIAAAKASYCAGQQAPKLFWQMHDWLFANQALWSAAQDAPEQFRKQAVAFGADGGKYDACLADAATDARVQKDLDDGAALGVQGTPVFFVNSWFISGAYPFQEFQDKIDKALQGLTPPPTPTPMPEGKEFFDLDSGNPGFTYNGSPAQGAADATVVLVSFEDFKSADAAKHVGEVEPGLRTKYVDAQAMRLVVVPFAETAPNAATAGLCAARGGKFWEYRAALYGDQTAWDDADAASLLAIAKQVGLNEADFTKCTADAQVQAVITNALDFGRSQIGVPATPSFLLLELDALGKVVDAKGLPGVQTLEQFVATMDALLAPPTPTPTPVAALAPDTLAQIPVGMDEAGNFYRGNPQAEVRLIEFSDFQ